MISEKNLDPDTKRLLRTVAGTANERKLLPIIHEPKTPGRWFLRRLYLQGRIDEFNELRKILIDSGQARSWGASFWPAAKMMEWCDTEMEKARCAEIELGLQASKLVQIDRVQRYETARRQVTMEGIQDKGESTYYQDVRWAYNNWPRFLRRVDGDWSLEAADVLVAEAPSTGAYGLILYAAENLKDFQALAARVLAKAEAIDGKSEAELKQADTGLDELRRVAAGL